MKHYLNFKPSIVFRKGSSFMLKTSLLILYGLPIVLVFFWSYNYFVLRDLNFFYEDAYRDFSEKSREFNSELAKIKPDRDELVNSEASYLSYRQLQVAFKTSFNSLFEALETVTPGSIMFKRISVKPGKLVRVSIDGEAEELSMLTVFIRSLFSSRDFLNPALKRHTRIQDSPRVTFSLEVDYLGKKGELP